MLKINLQNIEELIFLNVDARKLLSDFRHIFDQWFLSKRIPYLRSLGLRSLMDLLNGLDEKHIDLLEKYFDDSIVLDKIDYNIVKDLTFSVFDTPAEIEGFNNFAVARDDEQVYISFWR